MMKLFQHIGPVFSLIFCGVFANGQQVFQFSQYQQNLYLLNSATAGLHDYMEVNLSHRQQWVGINNSPTTTYLSANMPLGKRLSVNPKVSSSRISAPTTYDRITRTSFHAVGLLVSQDSYGPYSISSVAGSYTFHLPIAEELTLSFSPNVSFNTITFDQNKAVVEVANDQTYANYIGTAGQSSQFDINAAFWLNHASYFVGYSTDQLVQDRLRLNNPETLEKLRTHHNIIAGYRFILNRNFVLTPSTMLRIVSQAPLSTDINLRLDFQDTYWAGVTYRTNNTISGMVGLYLSNTIRAGYSFDYSLSSIQLQNAGSHEIMLGINLFNKEKAVF